jgi:hypothetical protein
MAVIADLSRLCLCESCVREMAECLAFEPSLHRRHLDRVREAMARADKAEAENATLRLLVSAGLAEEPEN